MAQLGLIYLIFQHIYEVSLFYSGNKRRLKIVYDNMLTIRSAPIDEVLKGLSYNPEKIGYYPLHTYIMPNCLLDHISNSTLAFLSTIFSIHKNPC